MGTGSDLGVSVGAGVAISVGIGAGVGAAVGVADDPHATRKKTTAMIRTSEKFSFMIPPSAVMLDTEELVTFRWDQVEGAK